MAVMSLLATVTSQPASLWSVEALIALLTLTALEIVLGIDNVIFIAILSEKLPPAEQPKARRIGLFLAMFVRVLLLLGITWVMAATAPLFALLGHGFSGRDLIMLAGGLFLIAKSTFEIHEKLEGAEHATKARASAAFAAIIVQIVLLDIVFSLDSVITAVAMANQIAVMIAAVVIAVGVMLAFAGRIAAFIKQHPTMKILALSFLLLIGVTLVVDGFGGHVGKGYIYFAMAFSVFIEVLNMRLRKVSQPVKLHEPEMAEESG